MALAAFIVGCTLIGTPLFWAPHSDGQWLFLMWSALGSTTVGIVAMVIAV
jgi:hypothetical protein